MIKRQIVLLLLIVFAVEVYSQTINVQKLDSLFTALDNNHLAMGSIAISVNGKIQYQRSMGSAFTDSTMQIPADAHTKYRIGSISKIFTAAMIFQLAEEKKLDTAQTIGKYFPTLPGAGKITVSNLLNHRSGLHDYSENTNFPVWMNTPKSQEELLKIIAEKKPDFEPGIKAGYSSSNYLLLSYIIEKIDNSSYSDALNKRIIKKIGLKDTYYGRPSDLKRNEASSYKYLDGKWMKATATDTTIHSGAGMIVSTPADLTKFIEALFTYRLVSKTSLDKMKTFVDWYGMGMFPYPFEGKNGFGHNGQLEEFASSLQYYPQEKLAVAYCSNAEVYAMKEILKGVLSICFNKPYTVPLFQQVVLPAYELSKFCGVYASEDPAINIVFTMQNNTLKAYTKGASFELVPLGDGYFIYPPFGYFFEFNAEKQELKIKEQYKVYDLKKH